MTPMRLHMLALRSALNCICFQLLCHKAVGTLSLKIESLFTSSTRAQTCAAPQHHTQSITSSLLKALFIMCISFISQGACYRPGPSPCNGMRDRHLDSLKSLYEASPFLCSPPRATEKTDSWPYQHSAEEIYSADLLKCAFKHPVLLCWGGYEFGLSALEILQNGAWHSSHWGVDSMLSLWNMTPEQRVNIKPVHISSCQASCKM